MKLIELLFLNQLQYIIANSGTEGISTGSDLLSELLSLSVKHSVTPLVAESLSRQGLLSDVGTAETYRHISYLSFVKWQQQENELHKITKFFEENQINHIPLKGAVIRNFYPEPWMRTSCDLDILVKEEQLDKAAQLLVEELGYQKKNKTGHDIMFLTPSGVNIELHYGFDEPELILKQMWETAVLSKGEYQFSLSSEWFILHHIAHMAKHFSIGGCGIRSLIDLWLILKNMHYNDVLLDDMLQEANLKKFFDVMCKLVTDWMAGHTLSDLQTEILGYVISGGVYGSIENRVIFRRSKQKRNTVQILFRRIFLSRDALAHMYPVVRKHLFLYPFCQAHRWFKVLRIYKIKSVSSELDKAQSVAEEVIEGTKKMMEQLGLSKR